MDSPSWDPSSSFYKDLPVVAKLFTPSVRCPNCSYTNDSDYRFCQRSGSERKILNNKGSTPFDVDANAIDDRLRQLALFDQATYYSRHKASLQRESENSLSSHQALLQFQLLHHVIFAVSW